MTKKMQPKRHNKDRLVTLNLFLVSGWPGSGTTSMISKIRICRESAKITSIMLRFYQWQLLCVFCWEREGGTKRYLFTLNILYLPKSLLTLPLQVISSPNTCVVPTQINPLRPVCVSWLRNIRFLHVVTCSHSSNSNLKEAGQLWSYFTTIRSPLNLKCKK